MFSLAELDLAAAVVYRTMPPTPQRRWPLLDRRCGTDVWVKHENHAPTGAFKIRGGLVFFDALAAGGKKPAGTVAATRGNHGQSVGFAARQLGIPATIVVPHGNSVEKNNAMRALGVELVEDGRDFQASMEIAARVAHERGWHLMPSFDPLLVKGVASYALELFRAAQNLEIVYVPIGLGSGICGTIAARDALGLRTKIVAVVAASAPAYARSLAAGRAVSSEATTRIADGMACRVPNDMALDLIRRGVERAVEVTDDAIEEAMRAIYEDTHNVAEGAGAAATAALLADRDRIRGKAAGVILTGSNVDRPVFARVLASDLRA
jgi:threonine dehydratase